MEPCGSEADTLLLDHHCLTINSFEIIALCKHAFLMSFIQRCRNGLQASVCSAFFVVHCTSELENRRPLTLSRLTETPVAVSRTGVRGVSLVLRESRGASKSMQHTSQC
ncbi:hypothetical protein AVEN_81764-1 [Araneus ventricosus]|uniref:Uncharacterized protein n=1 Tax=Araneus ventricosus TaxID=182803 RepID=A0A4Y2QY97_ARAVE|nr:hypothetical protein AVEN_81764-1 [Araneus ventricosus]